MKCAVHTEVDAAGFCRNCGKSMCGECKREVQGALYCEECLARLVSTPVSASAPSAGNSNPTLAAMLGVVPGLGAIYNGEYVKGILHVAILGTLLTLADRGGGGEALFVLMTIAFWFYMPIEAYRTAKARASGKKSADVLAMWGSKQPIGAYLLIGLGTLLLLDRVIPGFDPFRWVGRFWPVILIVLGLVLLRNRMQAPPEETKKDG